MSTARLMLDLFGGRMDAYGSDDGYAVRQPVTETLMQRHLQGVEPIGIYPIYWEGDTSWCRWGCCDIDTGEWGEAYVLATALRGMGMFPYVERSRSKGWHVWVFADEPVEPCVMRRALKVAYHAIDLPAKEANPKSENLSADQLGNYVRLPYKGWHSGTGRGRQIILKNWNATSDGEPASLSEFLDGVVKTPSSRLQHWAGKWFEPPRPHIEVDALTEAEMERLAGTIRGSLRFLFKDGPKHADRSAALSALAHGLAAQGFSADQTYAMICNADQRWGKYYLRVNGLKYLLDIVERAYT